MPDKRFYDTSEPVSLDQLSRLTGATLSSSSFGSRFVARVAGLDDAEIDSVSFFSNRRFIDQALVTLAGACFVTPKDIQVLPQGCIGLLTNTPQVAFAVAARLLHHPKYHHAGDGKFHPSVRLGEDVTLGPDVILGPGVMIGRGTHIASGAIVGPGVCIGRNCLIGPRVTIGFALIGDGVCIHGGAMIGEPGFGATAGPKGLMDIPQLGRVILQDGVTIGAGACIDRGALADTTIGENTKIDNLVQIGHNTVIGRNCVLAAHTGVSGSVVIEDGCQLGGRAGLADHIRIGAGARIAAAAGVMNDVPAGESWGGYPAKPIKRWLRETVYLTRLAQGRREG